MTALFWLAAALFGIGLFGMMARRSLLFQLLSMEVMLAGPALAFVAAGAARGDAQGQGMFVLILVLAAAEVGIGLSLYLRLSRIADVSDVDTISDLKG
ncbi:MAG: NADH-quinone oxidoreductase subunit NuoK [Alphaproteobacteria bacterium]|nr:MAG: NADH-quinone oxidoreductase subunit NuoK [Alphaproteobacteria bacterium]